MLSFITSVLVFADMDYEEDPGAVLDFEDDSPSEEALVEKQHPNKKKDRKLPCPTCKYRTEHVLRHVVRFHLPWFWVPELACWTCCQSFQTAARLRKHVQQTQHRGYQAGEDRSRWRQLVTGALKMVGQFLQLSGVVAIWGYVKNQPSLRPTVPIGLSQSEVDRMKWFGRAIGCQVPGQIDVQKLNSPVVILHWRITAGLLSLLSGEDRKRFARGRVEVSGVDRPCEVTGACGPSDAARTVDSHFHLDKLLGRSGKASLRQLEVELSPSHRVHQLVAIYCFPNSWPSEEAHLSIADDERLFFAYGIHPRQASAASRSQVVQVSKLLHRPRVVALGEVGLDYSRQDSCQERQGQQQVLEQLLPLAVERGLPVVFHCRGRGTRLATPDCIRLAKRHLPRDHPLHVHCFSEGPVEMRMWGRAFANVFFGFTATLLYQDRNADLEEVVKCLPRSRILLETDAPFLRPPGCSPRGYNVPWNIDQVAARIASLRRTTPDAICALSAANATRLYRL